MRFIYHLIVIFLLASCTRGGSDTTSYLSPYNIEWSSQSKNSSESMPLGGGDVGLNVWVENGELLMYVSQSGTFDENNQMLKLGRVRIKLKPNPFDGGDSFSQKLNLKDGNIIIKGKKGEHEVELNLWVDVFNPIAHIETESNIPVEITASYESWRTEDLEVPLGKRHASFSLTSYPGKVITYKDEVIAEGNEVMWYHRNRNDKLLYDLCVKQQGLEEVKDQIVNTQKDRTFGGILKGDNMVLSGTSEGKYISTNFKAWHLKTKEKTTSNSVRLYLHTNSCESAEAWKKEIKKLEKETSINVEAAKAKTQNWWNDYWKRSYICINESTANPKDSVWRIGRNYQLFRYMLGCNAYGDYPSKFNGSLFTVDPVFTREQYDWTPDFRCWGGGSFTAQNQRLVYWPMLKTGDFDMMPSQFKFYTRCLPSAIARTKVYWGHEGACFTEQIENFGLPFAGGWGFESGGRKRDPNTEFGVQTNPFVCHHYVNQLEFSLMILEYYRFSNIDISPYLDFIKSSLVFFDEHYQYRALKRSGEALDENGKLIIFPSTTAESYKNALNPVDVVAALRYLLPKMIELPEQYVNSEEKKYYKEYLERVPDVPTGDYNGHKVILPAVEWGRVGNNEFPELYTVFPYALYGINKPDYDLVLDTWNYGHSVPRKKVLQSWSQIPIFAARLGLTEEVKPMITWKLGDAPNRFPAFWGPGYDWVPDHNWGGSGMIALQEMLMQTDGKEIYLFPAWPKNWDVKFKMHAPLNTVIEAELKDGKLVQLNVFPEGRMKDIQLSKNIKH